MHTSVEPEDRDNLAALIESRGFAIFITFLSCFDLYGSVRHASARFRVPHYFLLKYDLFGSSGFGSVGWAVDLFAYAVVAYLVFSLLESASGRVEKALFIGLGGQFLINPVKMLVPRHASTIWWIELCLMVMCVVSSVAMLLRSTSGIPSSVDTAT
jgi:hypothetical protein